MTAKWEKTSGSQGVLTYEAPAEAFDKAVDAAFKDVVKTLNVPGFRKGKLPRPMFNKMYGEEALYQDALDILYRDTVQGAVEEAGFEPIALENIDVDGTLEKGKPVTFKVTFVVEPEAELGEYKGLEYEAVETTVTDEEVAAELDALQQQGAELAVKEGAIENGDTAVFDFAGFADGEQFEGGTAENYTLEIGSGQFIPGFEEQMVGLTAGEEKDVEVTFPEEYHADNLAGKPATFKVKLHEVKAKQVPELDDEFAKDIDESVSSLDELKAKIRERLETAKKQEAEGTMRDQLVEQATANATIDVPAVLVDQEVDRMVQEFGTRVSSQGIDLDMYFQLTGTTEEAMREEMKEQAEERVKARLVLKAIAEKEAIEVSDEDAEKELEEMSKLYNIAPDQLRTMLAPQGGIETLKGDLKFRKAIDVLVENGKAK
ncbi:MULTISPECIES: trigger factor [Exiguobacterium]|jgi:trigger factor|uniref:Trigger factor n=2 Tax=Exiguobacterium TaxID=33986 RepID=U1MWC7_9BACL|nr:MULTISPECIES: trigger factor [Exiguobacterium]ERG66216.1 trigger factor [Exiguobacterium chiriqhucha RW-2]KAB2863537.1 MAG: trigger factor [Exiguobacterium chiriqhucha]MCT4776729.1 trigger factor [Exiguobacterium aquaticum]MCT4788177.1 trigger factor [Exiguobacterium mexicanum]MDL5375587.1 trigger factor [Exiguobacterium mexicanum]